jgi:toxin ParE1/3/4
MLFISPQAEQDLVDIWLYIAKDSPVNADNFLDHLNEQAQYLVESPKSGKLRPELAHALRCFPIENYLMFYREQDSYIELVRVLHAARDLEVLF